MFVRKTRNTFQWPVRVKVPQDGGTFATCEFPVEFEALPQDEFNELLKLPELEMQAEIVRKTARGWDKVQDEAGDPIPFSDEELERMIAIPYVVSAMGLAYIDAVSGNKVRRKN